MRRDTSRPSALGGLEIDRHLEFDRHLDGKLAWLHAVQNLVSISRRSPIIIELVASVGSEATKFVRGGRAYRRRAIAQGTSSQRKCRFPCWETLPSLSLPPVEYCRAPSRSTQQDCAPTRMSSNHLLQPAVRWRRRDIETDRANLAHGRHPSSGSFRRNHPMAP